MTSLPTSLRRASAGAALLSAALFTACHRGREQTGILPKSDFDSVVQLTVQNNDFKDCDIYIVWEGRPRKRVGLATGKTTSTFTIDWVADNATIEGDFVAGGTWSADPISVQGGDHLDLVIMNEG